jgi:hypothetical protein
MIDRPHRKPLTRPALAFLAFLVFVLQCAPAAGQERVTIRGQVLDAVTRQPLRGVWVTAPLAGLTVLTDSLGIFSLSLIRDRSYELQAEDMGYHGLRFTLDAEAVEATPTVLLPPDPAMLSGLDTLERRLEHRRRQRGGRYRLVEHDSLLLSDETSAFSLVRRSVPMARVCRRQTENLCLPRGSRESAIRICVDDARPAAGASVLDSYKPADLWLVEIRGNGDSVRVYSRWFVDRIARTQQGFVALNPPC